MRIVLVGGGSGGHFYPLIAIVESLIERAKLQDLTPPELYYMGPDPYNAEMLSKHNIRFVRITAGKIRRYMSFRNFTDSYKTFYGIVVAIWRLYVVYPDVVMSKGGYTSVPVVIAAWLLRIPIVIHESDAMPGRANKLAAHFARYIAVSYDEVAEYFPEEKIALVGIPTRQELLDAPPEDPRTLLNIPVVPEKKPLILIIGGSHGAERVNDLAVSSLNDLLSSYEVLHQTGRENFTAISKTVEALLPEKGKASRYHPVDFLDAKVLHAAYTATSLVISRAGSTTIYEIALHGKPSILIPIPEDISHDQRANAYAYARRGAATVMEESNLTPHLLIAEITRIMTDLGVQNKMRIAASSFAKRDAAAKMADTLIGITQEHV